MPRHEAPTGPDLGREWWGPLEDLVRRVAGDPRHRFLDVADFQVELRVNRPPRPRILVYRHRYTRRVLHLDAEGGAHRFHPYRRAGRGTGQYRRHRSVDEALDALALFELPWMKPGLEGERRGLRWEDRLTLRWWLGAGRLDDDLSCLICRERRQDERRRVGDEGWILFAVDDEDDVTSWSGRPPPAPPETATPPTRPVLRIVPDDDQEDDDDGWI